MAYDPPTPAEFKIRYPSFSTVPDATVQAALDEAARWVDKSWFEADFPIARMLYAAHVLTLEGQGTSKESGLAGLAAAGLTSVKSGNHTVSLSESSVRGDAKKNLAGTFMATSYGQRFLALQRVNHPAVVVLNDDSLGLGT